MESSDSSIMPTPTVTIPIVGRLSKEWISKSHWSLVLYEVTNPKDGEINCLNYRRTSTNFTLHRSHVT